MAKFDVESAYRNIPVSPLDRHLLAQRMQMWTMLKRVALFR